MAANGEKVTNSERNGSLNDRGAKWTRFFLGTKMLLFPIHLYFFWGFISYNLNLIYDFHSS